MCVRAYMHIQYILCWHKIVFDRAGKRECVLLLLALLHIIQKVISCTGTSRL